MTETADGRSAPVFQLRKVGKVREKGGVTFELRVPEFEVRPGDLVAVVGPSGCGKSTLLDMLGLVLKPTTAERFAFRLAGSGLPVDVAGLSESELARVRMHHIGYVLQSGGLLPFLSVRDNILLPCRLAGTVNMPAIQKMAKRLGIADQMSKKPQHLSGGQRQRVAIARALAHHPPFVLADEPTAAVDRITAKDIQDKFTEVTRKMGVTLVMVTHDLALAKACANRFFGFKVQRLNENHTVSVLKEMRAAKPGAAS